MSKITREELFDIISTVCTIIGIGMLICMALAFILFTH